MTAHEKLKRKDFNKTLKLTADELDKAMWAYYKTLTREQRPKIANYLGHPTCSTLKRWYKFWDNKIEMKDIHREYIEFVLNKL